MWPLCYRLGLLTLVVAALRLTVVLGLQELREVDTLERALTPSPEVLYLCDSSNRWIDPADADRWALALMPALRTRQLQQDASLGNAGFLATPVYRGEVVAGRVRDFEAPSYRQPTPERTRNKFISHEMAAFDPSHRMLEALRRIGARARAHRLRLLCYVTPLDVATGESLLPGELRAQVTRNLAVIAAQWPSDLPPLLDLAFALPAEQFSSERYPNEHRKRGGRRLVAQPVAGDLHTAFGLGGG